jgi:TonB family protein
VLVSLALLGGVGAAQAQTEPPGDPRYAEAMARAKRENEKVYKWIKIHSDKPRQPPEAQPAQAAAAPAVPKPASPAKADSATKAVATTEHKPPAGTAASAVGPANDKAATVAAATAKANAGAQAPAVEAAQRSQATSASEAASAATVPEAAAVAMAPADPEPEDDSALVLLHQVDPDYPPALKRKLQKGWVQVRFEVHPDGRVVQPEIENSSHVKLNAAALQAVAQWRFQPVRRTQYGIVELNFDTE